jgi:hypothetical protein
MPIEIRELEISVKIDDGGGGPGADPATTPPDNVDSIVALCVDQVMDLLREQKEA